MTTPVMLVRYHKGGDDGDDNDDGDDDDDEEVNTHLLDPRQHQADELQTMPAAWTPGSPRFVLEGK
jgi:hypothetical protein